VLAFYLTFGEIEAKSAKKVDCAQIEGEIKGSKR
jgi:hypothetical protein